MSPGCLSAHQPSLSADPLQKPALMQPAVALHQIIAQDSAPSALRAPPHPAEIAPASTRALPHSAQMEVGRSQARSKSKSIDTTERQIQSSCPAPRRVAPPPDCESAFHPTKSRQNLGYPVPPGGLEACSSRCRSRRQSPQIDPRECSGKSPSESQPVASHFVSTSLRPELQSLGQPPRLLRLLLSICSPPCALTL